MNYQIKRVSDGTLFTVTQQPVWVNGIWECGNMRFTDPAQTWYASVQVYPILTPMQFYLAFTPTERIAIKNSTDTNVKEFWATYELAVQLNEMIDPNLVSVQEGLAWLATPTTATPAGPGILASTRPAQISQGIPQ
jgi:hypothetical protein